MENSASSTPLLWDSQPLPAYQYFENIRNFLVAVSKLKLPNFEASVFERVRTKCLFASVINYFADQSVTSMINFMLGA